MKLEKWLEKEEMTVNEFALAIDCTPNTVFIWKRGQFKPSKHLAKKIAEVTKGEVTAKDFKKPKKEETND